MHGGVSLLAVRHNSRTKMRSSHVGFIDPNFQRLKSDSWVVGNCLIRRYFGVQAVWH